VKFEQKPEIPIKSVDISRKTQKRVQAELEESQMVDHETFSPQFQMLNETARNMYSEQTSPYENPYQKAKYLPYFQYSSSNMKTPATATSVKLGSALTERSLSPMSSPMKESNWKQFVNSEVLHISRGVPSSGMKDGFMSARNNPNWRLFAGDEEESGVESPAKTNSSVSNMSRMMSSKLIKGMSPKKNKKNNQNNLDYVIVDANKRYTLPRSQKYQPKKVEFMKESVNKEKSLRYLSNMAD